jgi:hypothetical protein
LSVCRAGDLEKDDDDEIFRTVFSRPLHFASLHQLPLLLLLLLLLLLCGCSFFRVTSLPLSFQCFGVLF